MAQHSVFIVKGETGEYDCFFTWDVCAFLDRDEAIKKVARLRQWLTDKGIAYADSIDRVTGKRKCGDEWFNKRFEAVEDPDRPDKNLSVDYTGADYVIKEVPLAKENDDIIYT